MKRRQLTQTAKQMYNYGKQLAASGVSPRAWERGAVVPGVPDLLDLPFGNVDLAALFEMGLAGVPVRWVEGWRYGNVPASGRSTNYREQMSEAGVSLMELRDGERTQDEISALFISASNRPVVYVHGILARRRGSDGEPLVICATEAEYGTFECYTEEL